VILLLLALKQLLRRRERGAGGGELGGQVAAVVGAICDVGGVGEVLGGQGGERGEQICDGGVEVGLGHGGSLRVLARPVRRGVDEGRD
jgi:hypothetical protein